MAAVLLVLTATPARGHVTVTPKEAAKGSTTTFSFAVPNEEAPANTVSVELFWPDDASFTTVNAEPKPGWSATQTATSIKWSGGTITGDNREQFSVTFAPLPNDATLVFKALQTYDNGVVARWIDVGSADADHPAPTVTLTGDPVSVATTTPMTSPTPSVARPDVEADSGLGVGPIVFGAMVLAGMGAGIAIAMRRGNRAASG